MQPKMLSPSGTRRRMAQSMNEPYKIAHQRLYSGRGCLVRVRVRVRVGVRVVLLRRGYLSGKVGVAALVCGAIGMRSESTRHCG